MAQTIGGFQDVNPEDEHDIEQFSDEEPPPIKDSPPFQYFLIRQDVELEINFLERSLKGKTEIMIHALDSSTLQEIAIDARQCKIDTDKITVQKMRNGQPIGPPSAAPATYVDSYGLLDQPNLYRWNAKHASIRKIRLRPLIRTRQTDLPAEDRKFAGCTPVDGSLRVKIKNDEQSSNHRIIVRKPSANSASAFMDGKSDDEMSYVISIPFETKDIRDGLQFVGVEPGDMRYPHAYTRHSYEPGTACCLFPCIDDHGSLGDWKISIKCPRTLGDVLHQPLVTQRQTTGNGSAEDQSAENSAVEHILSEEDKLLEMTVVCSGLLTDEIIDPNDDRKKVMTFESEKATSVHKIGFAVGPFEHVDLFSDFRTEEDDEKLGASALKIHGYCLPRRADWVRNTCVALATAADYLSLTFSGYPYDSYKLCFVEDLVEDTLPLYSFSFVSTRLLYSERIIDTEVDVTRKLVHSLATQWSGACVIPNTRRDRWVTTGIAYYMTDLFMKKLCGNNEYRFRIKVAADKLVEMDINRPSLYDLGQYLHVGDFEREFMDLKAPLVLFILDKRIVKATSGSHNLTQILSRLFTKAKIEGDNVITTKSFRKLCEKTSKYSLDTFWEQWVYGSGCPRIQVTHRFNKKRLCVEMTISQVQSPEDVARKEMQPSDFLRAIKEKQYGVVPGPVQALFTGPITIRIHEADGTPYEHIVEIREDTAQKRMVKFDIPYNTKYKRLKRRREKKQASAGAAAEAAAAGSDEGFIYCLGDTINTPADMERFRAEEYNEATEKQMDAESYEWLRVDTDFEWLCSMKVGMAHYMFVSQLQQDRDIVAQEDTLLYIQRESPHPVASTVLARTLMDIKYFYGIRTMAAELLKYQCNDAMGMRGMVQLEMAFRDMFCIPGSNTPKPNDFTDKRQYLVQCAIPESLSQVRDKNGKCPLRIKRFILDLLRLNNNSQNDFNDDFYVAKLITSVANTLIPSKMQQTMSFSFDDDEVDHEREEEKLKEEALEEINRHLRRDEWSHSYQNVWTIAGLDAKQRLMKAGVIPVDGLDFVKYLQDATYDDVRIKCWAALVDLGFMIEPVIFKLFMYCLSTDRSPYVRDRLMKILCEGLATIAFGEYAKPKTQTTAAHGTDPAIKGDPDLDMADADDDGLVVVNNEATERAHEEQRKLAQRKKDLPLALAALKKEMESTYADVERELQRAVWKAIDSPALGHAERITLLELCVTMFDEADRWIITLQYPKRWKVTRNVYRHNSSSLLVNFKSYYRTKPLNPEPLAIPPQPPTPAPSEPKRPLIVARSSSIKVSRPSISATSAGGTSATAAPSSEKPSIAVTVPSHADSIVASPAAATPKPQIERKNTLSISTSSSNKSAKRPRDKLQDAALAGTPAPKRPKVEKTPKSAVGTPSKRSRIVTIKHPSLRETLKKVMGSDRKGHQGIKVGSLSSSKATSSSVAAPSPPPMSSIQAKPARKPLPMGPAGSPSPATTNGGARVPLPDGKSSAPAPAPPPRPKIMLKLKRPDPPP
ncbi:hypothetical protein jhhlp_004522 [Lomentospora prolificans]|uniref:Transcription initiation factor TFIID subunit 2 n=1 Tax=Lomentospora prolificans TaxID=41688 RepID=A0A2N3NBU0_9PEZI|nr:hypothetical protein jhhlp_004522 [Lomentospora prolificans]